MSFSGKIMQLNIIKLSKLRWSQKDNIVRFFLIPGLYRYIKSCMYIWNKSIGKII